MIIPGQIISLATFPGVVVHEFSHQIFCRLFNIEVHEVCYFRLGNPAGYVTHEPSKKWTHNVLIAAGPFFINSAIAALLAFPVVLKIDFNTVSFSGAILLWLAISIGMHAIPSTGDAKSMWNAVSGNKAPFFAKVLVSPIIAVIYLLSLGSFFWLDLVYGLLIAFFAPLLLIQVIS
tara:strand:- start:1512 stop:2039 length:528 start_codon:yes stop_codon:yes gene_type:complete